MNFTLKSSQQHTVHRLNVINLSECFKINLFEKNNNKLKLKLN